VSDAITVAGALNRVHTAVKNRNTIHHSFALVRQAQKTLHVRDHQEPYRVQGELAKLSLVSLAYTVHRTFTVELRTFVCDIEYLAIDCHVQFTWQSRTVILLQLRYAQFTTFLRHHLYFTCCCCYCYLMVSLYSERYALYMTRRSALRAKTKELTTWHDYVLITFDRR